MIQFRVTDDHVRIVMAMRRPAHPKRTKIEHLPEGSTQATFAAVEERRIIKVITEFVKTLCFRNPLPSPRPPPAPRYSTKLQRLHQPGLRDLGSVLAWYIIYYTPSLLIWFNTGTPALPASQQAFHRAR